MVVEGVYSAKAALALSERYYVSTCRLWSRSSRCSLKENRRRRP